MLIEDAAAPAPAVLPPVPWAAADAFPIPQTTSAYGYVLDKKLVGCTRDDLIKQIREDKAWKVRLVWTPHDARLAPPEQAPFLYEATMARAIARYKNTRSNAFWTALVWGGLGLFASFSAHTVAYLQLILVASYLIGIFESTWELRRLRKMAPTAPPFGVLEARYCAWLPRQKAPVANGLAIGISVLAALQLLYFMGHMFGSGSSIAMAGLVKDAVRNGEVWRILTTALLHANPWHFMFNILALLVFGRMVELLAGWVYVGIVFVVAALCGSLFSLVLLPNLTSVGSSGGIMGLLGFLVVLGYLRRASMPPDFLGDLLRSVASVALVGLVAISLIDNPAHLGGFLGGALVGLLAIPRDDALVPLPSGKLISGVSLASLALLSVAALFTATLLLRG